MKQRASSRPAMTGFDHRSLMLFAALSLGSAGATWAQSTAVTMDNDKALVALFTQADKDADKALSPEEAQAIPALAERFAQVDSDGDGKVTGAEFMASMSPARK
jgi:Ca2+-binding EF-hand superfamily protein